MNLFEVCDPLTLLDSYKLAHREQYGPKVEYIYSNWTPRSSRLEGVDKVVFFGLQYFLKEYLGSYWDKFFYGNIDWICEEYERKIQLHLGSKPDTQHLRDLHKLGYLPLEFKALPEGTEVPLRVPMFTVENTHPKFAWLVNYIESILSNVVWLPCTSATIALRLRKLLNKRAIESGLDESAVDFQGHDFSFRGMKGLEAAVLSGAGHLLSFKGSDTVPAIDFLEYYYGAEGFIAGSVPASEHSSSTLDGPENELETYRRFINLYPKGFVSLVADSYDYWSVLTDMMPKLKEQIMSRDGRVVIRPDCYSDDTEIMTRQGWKKFSEIDINTEVAEVLPDGSYEFVKPLKYVAEDYNGEMIHFHDEKGKLDLLVTPNHRMIYKKDGKWSVQFAEQCGDYGYYGKNIVRSAKAQNKYKKLTPIERLQIAFQADGSYVTGCHNSIRFHFTKERKINRIKELAKLAKVKYNEYPIISGGVELHLKIKDARYIFKKDLYWVDTTALCENWCEEFIEELKHWDSSIRNDGRFKFDTTNPEVIKVVELVALSAGKGVLLTQSQDNRKEHFSDVYTAHIMNDNELGGQAVKKEVVQYSGKVYCVQVPSGMLLVKRNRGTAVCGNSGDPVKVVIGDKNAPEGSPEYKGSIELLWEVFGGTYTPNGLKLLDSHIGLIYGDAITYERADEITKGLIAKGFASTNIVFGVGSYTYSYVTRDTFGFAFKTTGAVVDGVERAVFKDPKTDNGIKKSLRGFISVRKNEDGKLVAVDQLSREESSRDSLLEVVWRDGQLLTNWTFDKVKENLHATS